MKILDRALNNSNIKLGFFFLINYSYRISKLIVRIKKKNQMCA